MNLLKGLESVSKTVTAASQSIPQFDSAFLAPHRFRAVAQGSVNSQSTPKPAPGSVRRLPGPPAVTAYRLLAQGLLS